MRMLSTQDQPTREILWSGLPVCDEWVGSSEEATRIRGEIATVSLSADPVVIVAEAGTGRRLTAELIHRSTPGTGANATEGFLPVEVGSIPGEQLVPHLEAVAGGTREDGNRPGRRTLYLSGFDRGGLSDLRSLPEIPGIRFIASRAPPAKALPNARRKAPASAGVPGVTTIQIPPLRDRKTDISPLALRFLTDACRRCGVGPYGISSRMVAAYHDYDWPGNAAELRAVIESAVSTAALARFRGRILPDSFCATCFDGDRTGRSLKQMIGDFEKNILETTLHRLGGNQTHAARLLRLNTTTLHEKLKRHDLLSRTSKRHGRTTPP